MTYLLGFTIIYLIPAALAAPFWFLVRHLAAYWDGRNFLESCTPHRRHVHHTERITGVLKLK